MPRFAPYAAHEIAMLSTIPGSAGSGLPIGLIPGAGDVLTTGVSAYALLTATRMGAPASVIARMAGNIVLDLLVGAIPLVGDLFDIGWKANTRNVKLLERFAADPKGARRGSLLALAVAFGVILAVLAGVAWLLLKVLGWVSAQV